MHAQRVANTRKLSDEVKRLCLQAGFAACGITGVEPFVRHHRQLRERSERYPESATYYAGLSNRQHPSERAPWARSIVVGMLHYGKYRIPDELAGRFGKYYLADTRLAFSRETDAFNTFQESVTALGIRIECHPMPLRELATRAGIGSIGKNNFIYSQQFGSWIALRSWYVDASLDPDEPSRGSVCPKGCRRCIDACPTGALVGPYSMNYARCIAHLSYDVKKLPDLRLLGQMGEWLYGCDVCQDVCPLNERKWSGNEPFPGLAEMASAINLLSLARGHQPHQQVRQWFWYIDADRTWLWQVNALRALTVRTVRWLRRVIRGARRRDISEIP